MMQMRAAFVRTAGQVLAADPSAAVVLAAISGADFEPLRDRYPDRVIDVGIREQLMIGVAGGLALTGMRPVVHTYAPFLVERAYEQVKLDLGHQGVGAVLVSVGASYDWAEGGQTHRGAADVALIGTLDGWHVHVPGHADEVGPLLRAAVADDGRHYIRLSTASNDAAHPAADGVLLPLRQGTASSPVVVAVGPLLDPVLEAAGGLDVTVLYATTVRPLDAVTLRAAVADSAGPRDVVLAEPYLAGTSRNAVAAALEGIWHRLTCLGVGVEEVRRYGTAADHDRHHGLDAAGIRAVLTRLDAGRQPAGRQPAGRQSAGRQAAGRETARGLPLG